MEKLRFSHLT